MNRPALVMVHNKTLAAQLYQEFRRFFPQNAVEFFVSYYDYYQPEAYMPATDSYIEKEAIINEEIDRLRLSATRSLFERRDVIIVASVSCIYGLGSPEAYYGLLVPLEKGQRIDRDEILRKLVEIQYERNDHEFTRGTFRVRGDIVEVYPSYDDVGLRIGLFGDEIDELVSFDPLTGREVRRHDRIAVYPEVALRRAARADACRRSRAIKAELAERLAELEARRPRARSAAAASADDVRSRDDQGDRLLPRHRELLAASVRAGCRASRRRRCSTTCPSDALIIVDESHQTVPQVRGMYHGDRSRKEVLVEHGFRLPSALDNRPLNFEEWEARVGQVVFVSATPGPYELRQAGGVIVEQIIRPTGLVDPVIDIRPVTGQIDDLLGEIRAGGGARRARAGDDAHQTHGRGPRRSTTRSWASGSGTCIRTSTRSSACRSCATCGSGTFDVLVGINLLREGLDLPEVSLVAILDADKEGFLRSAGALIQTIGRAARNVNGRAILYADAMTDSMRQAMDETDRRRQVQEAYNAEHGITPASIVKNIDDVLSSVYERDYVTVPKAPDERDRFKTQAELDAFIAGLEREMRAAAANLEFERAAAHPRPAAAPAQSRPRAGADGRALTCAAGCRSG